MGSGGYLSPNESGPHHHHPGPSYQRRLQSEAIIEGAHHMDVGEVFSVGQAPGPRSRGDHQSIEANVLIAIKGDLGGVHVKCARPSPEHHGDIEHRRVIRVVRS